LNELTAQQRGIAIYKALLDGPKRVCELEALAGISQRGVYRILENISQEGTLTNAGGYWYVLSTEEQNDAFHIVKRIERDLATITGHMAYSYPLPAADAHKVVRLLKRLICAPEPD
jgi:predicted DNA-binding transcriptional regulator